CPSIASTPRLASAARDQAALWETCRGQRRPPSRGVLRSDAVAMRCVRMPAALNSAHHDPHPTETRPCSSIAMNLAFPSETGSTALHHLLGNIAVPNIYGPLSTIPTVSLDVISLVASSCGYYRSQIEPRPAQ